MSKATFSWRGLAEILGIFGIVASLIFVAMEIQQNTSAIQSATVQDISRWSYDASVLMLEQRDLIGARQAACTGTMSEDQRTLLFIYFASLLRLQFNRFQQAELSILDQELSLNMGGRGGAYTNPYFAEAWTVLQDEFGSAFREFIEREILPISQNGCRPGAEM